jgi:hypothetical protein
MLASAVVQAPPPGGHDDSLLTRRQRCIIERVPCNGKALQDKEKSTAAAVAATHTRRAMKPVQLNSRTMLRLQVEAAMPYDDCRPATGNGRSNAA